MKTKTECNFCGKKLTRANFDVVIGTYAFFLCTRHFKALMDYIVDKEIC